MRTYCTASARPYLFEFKPSRRLELWWWALHLLIGSAALAARPAFASAAIWLVLTVVHFVWRYPPRRSLLLVVCGQRFALPWEGRFNLSLAAVRCVNVAWVRLAFDDRPGSQILLLPDQLAELEWRRFCLILRERG